MELNTPESERVALEVGLPGAANWLSTWSKKRPVEVDLCVFFHPFLLVGHLRYLGSLSFGRIKNVGSKFWKKILWGSFVKLR